MFDAEGCEHYLRQKYSLEREIERAGSFRVSKEIETQMIYVEERLLARIKQAHFHSTQELSSLKMILLESLKPDNKA